MTQKFNSAGDKTYTSHEMEKSEAYEKFPREADMYICLFFFKKKVIVIFDNEKEKELQGGANKAV